MFRVRSEFSVDQPCLRKPSIFLGEYRSEGWDTMLYRFSQYVLDDRNKLVYRGENLLLLPPKRTELLFFLVLNAGRIVSKAEIMANVWPGYLVGDSNLAKQISLLRKVIEENEQNPVRIVTVSGRGYMFREKVVRLDTSDNETGGWVDVHQRKVEVQISQPDRIPIKPLTDDELARLTGLCRQHGEWHVRTAAQVVLLLDKGFTPELIGRIVDEHPDAIRRIQARWNERQIEGVLFGLTD
ncbi:MAG: hypothetical protein EBZ36_03555 [Acidobacteria bacterium]|nr:hypothetical protein [Acidobacteriota bacterium]